MPRPTGLLTLFAVLLVSCSSKIDRKINWLDTLKTWKRTSPGKDHSIREIRETNPIRRSSIRFELRTKEAWKDPKGKPSYRADLHSPLWPVTGSELWYSCGILIPKNFPTEKTRLSLIQWWSRPKPGESAKAPAIILKLVNGTMVASLRHSDLQLVKQAETVPTVSLFEMEEYPLGNWNDFIFLVKWSPREDGLVRIWFNGKLIANYTGPVGYNDETGPVFRFGIQRDNSQETYIVFFSDCREGQSYDEVDPQNYH